MVEATDKTTKDNWTVTAEYIKQLRDSRSARTEQLVTAEWLRDNQQTVNNFIKSVEEKRASDFNTRLQDANTWQTQATMDDTIRRTESMYKSGSLNIGWEKYNEILTGLKNNKESYAQFTSADEWQVAADNYELYQEIGDLTYDEVQDGIRQVKQSMELTDDEEHKAKLQKRLNFLENYHEITEVTDTGYYDAQISQLETEKKALLDEQKGLDTSIGGSQYNPKYNNPGDVERNNEINHRIGEINGKITEMKAHRENADLQEQGKKMQEYFPRVEIMFDLGEDAPLQEKLAAAYELQEMDKYISQPDFQQVLQDLQISQMKLGEEEFHQTQLKGLSPSAITDYIFVNQYTPQALQSSYLVFQNMDQATIDWRLSSAKDARSRLATSMMLQSERDVYNYIRITEGSEAATAFLDEHVLPRITGEIAEEVQREAEELALESPVASWLLAFANKAILQPIEGALNTVHMAVDPEGYQKNWVKNEHTILQTNTIRQTQSEALGDVGGFIYNVGTGAADLAAELALSKISATYLSSLGAVDKVSKLKKTVEKADKGGKLYYLDQAARDRITGWTMQTISASKIAGETLSDARARGLSGTQAVGEALSMAAIEWATEKIGLDNLLKADGSVIRSMLSEGLEEGLSSIASPIVDAWIAGDKSNWQMSIRNYINDGKSYEDAVSLAFRDVAGDVVYEAGLGALTGGVFKGSMKLVNTLTGNGSVPKAAVWVRSDTGKTKALANAAIKKWGSITMSHKDVGEIYIDSKKQLAAVSASQTGQEAAAVASISKVVSNGKVVPDHTKQGKMMYEAMGAQKGDVLLSTPMRMRGDERGALHSVTVRLTPAGEKGQYAVSGVLLDGDVLMDLTKAGNMRNAPLATEAETGYTDNREPVTAKLSLGDAETDADYDALDRYDGRAYANFGWVTVNRVLTGKELKKFNSQWADAVKNGFKYPTTSSGETIITVGDAYGDADKLVYVSGTMENPIISKVVQIKPSDPGDISAIRQNIIDMEVEGHNDIWNIVATVFGEDVFRIQSSANFRSYRELAGARQDRQSNTAGNGDHQQRSNGGGSSAADLAGDRSAVSDTDITNSSLPSNDGAGTDSYTQNAENPQQSAVGVDSRAQNPDAVRDRGVEIGVRPSEMDTTFNKMGERQRNKVLTTLEKNTGAHIVLDETLDADGEYDPSTKTIRINPNRATPVTVIKHELTHFIESSGMLYQDLMNYAVKSRAFSEWLESKGESMETMRKKIYDRYADKGEQLDRTPGSSVDQEILANFVAEKLFTDLDALCALKAEKPKLFNRFRAWLSRKIHGYKGTPIEKELRHMEKMFAQAVEQASKTTETTPGLPKFSFGVTQIDIDEYVDNAYEKKNTKDYIKYAKASERLIADTKDQIDISKHSHALRDNDIRHINLSHGEGKPTEKYPVTRDDIKSIPEIVENYDKVVVYEKTSSQIGLMYVKVAPNGLVYYLEQITDKYHNEPLLVNKQMIKTGVEDIPDLPGFVKAINKKQTVAEFLADLQEVRQVYAQSVKQQPSDDISIPQGDTGVNTQYTQNGTKKFIAPDTTVETPGDQLTDEELLSQIRRRVGKTLNPLQIAQLIPEDASTIPQLYGNGWMNRAGVGQSAFGDSVQGASIFSDELKQLAAEDENITRYDVITNKETMQAANQRINEGGRGFVIELEQKAPAFYTADDIAAAIILVGRYEKVGDHRSALSLLEKVREAGTISGQAVQTLSLLSRLSPEGMLAYAQKELSQAYQIMIEGKTNKWIRDNADRFQLTDEDIEFILRHTWQAAQLPKGRDKNIRLAEIAERIQSKIPQEPGQAFKAWQRTAMLLNPKTQLRNIIGNATMAPVFIASDTIGSGIDALISKKTGVRTTKGFQMSSVKGMAKGFYESYDDFRRHISTKDINADRFEIKAQSSKNFNEHHKGFAAGARNKLSKALNALDRFDSFLLEAGDRSFYEMWFLNSLNGQMKANGVTEPTADMIEIATQEALSRTWQDSNNMTGMVTAIKQGLNRFNVHGYGLGDVFIKFSKTPANLTKAIVDFSPAGFLKAVSADAIRFTTAVKEGRVTPQMQRKFVKNLSNGITGTLMTALFAALASAGLMTGEQDEDKDVSAFERAVLGKQPYSFRIGNMSFSYDWAQPAAAQVAMMANFFQDKRNAELTGEKKIWYQSILDAFKTGGEVLYNQSFMQSLQNLFADDDFITNALNGILSDVSASVPQILSQTAAAFDPTARTTYEPGNDVQEALNNVLYKLPGARQTLAPSVDVLGNERKQIENPVGRAAASFFSPANIAVGYDSVAGNEMYRLYRATGEASAIAPVAPSTVNTTKGKYTLTSHQKAEYQKITGKMSSNAVENLVGNKAYQRLDDELKVELLTSIYSYSKQVANNTVLGVPVSSNYAKAHEAISAGVPVELYYLLKKTASTDGNDGISQEEARAALNASGLTKEQKRIMSKFFNDQWKNNWYQPRDYY